MKPKQIRKRFGRKVARIVKACTETLDGELPTKSKAPRDASTWRARKQETIDHLAAPDVPQPVLRVKGADALANARVDRRRPPPHGPEVWQRFHAGAVDQLWYYRSLAVILVARHPGALSDELRAAVTEMERCPAGGSTSATRSPAPTEPADAGSDPGRIRADGSAVAVPRSTPHVGRPGTVARLARLPARSRRRRSVAGWAAA